MKELLGKLEQKLTLLVGNNKKLQAENATLKSQLKSLGEEKGQLETSLLKEHGNMDNMVKEKDSIKDVIESLLENINKLESAKE
jgi:hypothetical protein